MLLRRSASICSKWRQQGEVLLHARLLSGSLANEDLNFSELAQQPKLSASNTETLFGIAPRKVIDEEDEDFVPPTPSTALPSPVDSSKPQNYFSKTWAMQKSIITGASVLMEEELPPPSQDARFPQLIPTHRSALKRTWQVAQDSQACSYETFKFVSLKVLSTDVCKKHKGQLYSYASNGVLDWKSRRKKLFDDLDQLSADIICLQELDKFHDMQSDMSLRGYAGLYKVSTGASGRCAIFWNQKRFKLLHEESIDFSLLGLRSNVGQLCVFQSTVPGTADDGASSNAGNHDPDHRNCLLVGNIDSLFNPRRGEIKLAQCRTFLKQAHKLSNEWPGAPIVIGGCFHATPQSPIYKFFAESKVDVFGLKSHFLSGHFVKDEKSSQSPATMSGTKKGVTRVDVLQRLRNSILKKTTSEQDSHAVKLENSASLSSYQIPVHGDNASPKACVFKTVGLLESSMEAREALRVVDENVGGVDASPRTINSLESDTNSNSNCPDSKLVEPTGSTVEHVSSVSASLNLHSPGDEVPKHDCPVALDPIKEASSVISATCGSSGPSTSAEHGWDPDALKMVSGSDNCTVVKHDLKLFSVYPEVQGEAATRDSNGEPCMTMLHDEFKGTVDYIWRSEGLKTMKVLDTFSWNEMAMAPSIPFVVSGSDHVSLACELGFWKSRVQP